MLKTDQPISDHDTAVFKQSFDRLNAYLAAVDFKGYEYDDLLASPLVRSLCRPHLYTRIAAVQAAKRLPFNIRPFVGVPKLQSTKAWGFIVKGLLCHYLATGEDRYLPVVRRGLQWLMDNHSQGYAGICWGNDFDFASRGGFMPKGLPTVVWSSHIQEAFDLAYSVFGDSTHRAVVVSVADFIASDLEKTADSPGSFIGYAPGSAAPIHNSNLLGALALMRAFKHTADDRYSGIAREALTWSLARMNADGSWYYGNTPMLHWIDNYHTGYVLDCLCGIQDIAGTAWVPDDIIQKTYTFWRDHFFEPSGRPRFYHNRTFPSDIQATAQAIESFAKYSTRDVTALGRAALVASWALSHMQKPNGAFRYRLYKFWKNDLEAIHWGQATMLSALAHLIYYRKLTHVHARRA